MNDNKVPSLGSDIMMGLFIWLMYSLVGAVVLSLIISFIDWRVLTPFNWNWKTRAAFMVWSFVCFIGTVMSRPHRD